MGEGGGCDSTATSTLVCTLVVWSCFRISISKYIVKKCPQFPGGPRIKWELRNLLVFTVSPIGFIFFIKNRNSHQMPIMASCCGNGIFSLPTLRTAIVILVSPITDDDVVYFTARCPVLKRSFYIFVIVNINAVLCMYFLNADCLSFYFTSIFNGQYFYQLNTVYFFSRSFIY